MAPPPAAGASLASAAGRTEAGQHPSITWDLRLRPPSLEHEFWADRSPTLVSTDFQVLARFHLAGFAVYYANLMPKLGFKHHLANQVLLGCTFAVWALGMKAFPRWYRRHRTVAVVVLRMAVGVTQRMGLDGAVPFLSDIGNNKNAPVTTLMNKFILPSNLLHHHIESNGHPLPYMLNVWCCFFKSLLTLISSYMRGVVAFASVEPYHGAMLSANERWAEIIQPIVPVHVPPHERLAGRCTAVFLAIAVTHVTAQLLAMLVTWLQMCATLRAWLRSKLAACEHGVVQVGAVCLSREQLQQLLHWPAAAALVDPLSASTRCPSATRALAVAFHALVLGALLQASLLLGQLYVLQLCPRLMPQRTLELWFPLAPAGVAAS